MDGFTASNKTAGTKSMIHGYTLTELLITLLISAILLAIGIPTYHDLVLNNRQTTQINQLVAAINFTRSEAILQHAIVTLCKSKDSKICGGEWSDGWIIFIDKNASGQMAPGNQILRIYPATPSGSALSWKGQRSNDYLQMEPSGGTHGQAGTFTYYPDVNNKQKMSEVIISQTGRIRVV